MDRLLEIRRGLDAGISMAKIGASLGVSKQRIYQIMTQHGIQAPNRKRLGYWKRQNPQRRWLWRTVCSKSYPRAYSKELFDHLAGNLPEVCPILGITLEYIKGTRRNRDDSPSIDRIDPNKGYVVGNVQIVSFRANRIKNDGTPLELRQIADFMNR